MFGVHLQHPTDESLRRLADCSLLPVLDLSAGDEPIELELVSRAKGKDAHDEQIEYHPQGPNIGLSAIVRHFLHQLGAHIRRRSTEIGECDAGVGAEPEIYQLYVSVIVDEDVLWLQVTMTNALFVTVVYPLQNFPKVLSCACLREGPLLP
jgi:hypothetical protein